MESNPMTTGSTQWLGPGFTTNNVAAYAFKKGLARGNTSLEAKYYQEPIAKPSVFQEWIPSNSVPLAPPTDFVALTAEQIKTQFGVLDAEIAAWHTYVDAGVTFSIEQSTSYPYLFKVNNCLLTPFSSNPQASYWAMTLTTQYNLLQSAIPFTFGDGGYKGIITRTLPSESGVTRLSNRGRDVVFSQHLAYIFDYDTGVFTAYHDDNSETAMSPITVMTPPAITCYLYKGGYGQLAGATALEWRKEGNGVHLINTSLQVLVGTNTITNPSLVMDVSGTAFIRDIITTSVSTASDRRLKENIRPFLLPKGILNLAPRLYNYIAKPGATELGLIAQEVEEYVPELVRESGGMKSLQYDRLGVLLLPIVKEQEERLRVMETELSEMRELMGMLIKGTRRTSRVVPR